jgi:hypothetical protein
MSYIMSIMSLVLLYLMGNKWKYAPLFGVVLQVLWFYYSIVIVKDMGLLIGVVGYTVIHVRNSIKWLKN